MHSIDLNWVRKRYDTVDCGPGSNLSCILKASVGSLRPFCLGMWVKQLVSYNNTSWPALKSCQSPLCRQLTFQLTLWHWFLWYHVTFFLFVGILFMSGIFKLKYITIRFRIQLRIGSTIKTIIKSDSNLLVGDVYLLLLYCARSFKNKFRTTNLEIWTPRELFSEAKFGKPKWDPEPLVIYCITTCFYFC